jgi:tRNA dimethylallyltransferase
MVRDGFINEVKVVIKKYGPNAAALNAIGYREIAEHLNGGAALEDAVAAIKMNTWHYAKRQMTWFKKYGSTQWITSAPEAISVIGAFLK